MMAKVLPVKIIAKYGRNGSKADNAKPKSQLIPEGGTSFEPTPEDKAKLSLNDFIPDESAQFSDFRDLENGFLVCLNGSFR